MEQKPNRLSMTLSNLGLFLFSTMEIAIFVILAIVFIITFFISFALNPASPNFENVMNNTSNNYILLSIASQLVVYLILTAILILVFRKKVHLKEALCLNGFDFVTLLLTLAVALIAITTADIFGIFADFVFSLLGIPLAESPGLKELFQGPEWLIIFSVCVMAPLFEEFLFRGVIFNGYSKRYGIIKAALFSGLLFALIHGFLPSVIAIIPVGFIFGLLAGYSKSLYLTIIAHAAYNGLALTGFIDDIVLFPQDFLVGGAGDVALFVWLLILLPICGFMIFYIMKEIKKRTDKKYPEEQILIPKERPAASTTFFVLAMCLLGISFITTNFLAYDAINLFNIGT